MTKSVEKSGTFRTRERGQRLRSPKRPVETPSPPVVSPKISTRSKIFGLGILGVALTAGIAVIGHKNDSKDSTSVSKSAPNAQKDDFKLPENLNIDVPNYEYRSLPEKEINKDAAVKFIQSVHELVAKLQSSNPSQKNKIIDSFLEKELASVEGNASMDIDEKIDHMNTILIPAGLYFFMVEDSEGNYRISLFTIEKQDQVHISDNIGEMDVPVLILGADSVPADLSTRLSYMYGSADRRYKRVLTFKSNIEKMSKPLGINDAESMEKFMEGNAFHEATHVMLASRFPKMRPAVAADKKFPVNFSFPVPGGSAAAEIKGDSFAVQFHEVCANGAEFASSPVNSLDKVTSLLTDRNVPFGYVLLKKLLAYAVLSTLPPSSQKTKILGEVATGNLSFIEIAAQVQQSGNDVALQRRIGQILYRIGYDLIQKGEASN